MHSGRFGKEGMGNCRGGRLILTGRDSTARGDAAGDELEYSLNEALEHTVCFGDAGGDWDAYKVCCGEAANGGTGWIDAVCLGKYEPRYGIKEGHALTSPHRGWPASLYLMSFWVAF